MQPRRRAPPGHRPFLRGRPPRPPLRPPRPLPPHRSEPDDPAIPPPGRKSSRPPLPPDNPPELRTSGLNRFLEGRLGRDGASQAVGSARLVVIEYMTGPRTASH